MGIFTYLWRTTQIGVMAMRNKLARGASQLPKHLTRDSQQFTDVLPKCCNGQAIQLPWKLNSEPAIWVIWSQKETLVYCWLYCLVKMPEHPDENSETTTVLMAANIAFDFEDIMEQNTKKILYTTTDGCLSADYVWDHIFVNNPLAGEFTNAWVSIQLQEIEDRQRASEQKSKVDRLVQWVIYLKSTITLRGQPLRRRSGTVFFLLQNGMSSKSHWSRLSVHPCR